MKAYHFTGDTLLNGAAIPEIGQWLKHDGPIIVCGSGLHASRHPFDALQYAPGSILHKVELRGELKSHGDPIDKYVGRERRIIASLDCEQLLWYFARQCALSVAHLWDAPDVVLEYLVTGDESKRYAARYAARAAAWDAAWDAARDAARAAARYAARDAARYAAWDAAWYAARYAAWYAAWDAAWDANRQLFLNIVNQAFKEEGTP